ncbi:MAG: outer membrane protein assembly factor BamA, partial [Hyphomicrobiales bacterium]
FGHNIDLSFPLGPTLSEMGVKGVIFTDGGWVSDFDSADGTVQDSQTYRISAGTGIHWRSPIGPLRVEFGMPIMKADEDRDQIFSFAVGTRF